MSKKTEAIESFLVSGNGRSPSVVANGRSSLRKRGLPPPTQVKFTGFKFRSRIVNVYKRFKTGNLNTGTAS